MLPQSPFEPHRLAGIGWCSSGQPNQGFFHLFPSSLREGCAGNCLWMKSGIKVGPSHMGHSGKEVEWGFFLCYSTIWTWKGEN